MPPCDPVDFPVAIHHAKMLASLEKQTSFLPAQRSVRNFPGLCHKCLHTAYRTSYSKLWRIKCKPPMTRIHAIEWLKWPTLQRLFLQNISLGRPCLRSCQSTEENPSTRPPSCACFEHSYASGSGPEPSGGWRHRICPVAAWVHSGGRE